MAIGYLKHGVTREQVVHHRIDQESSVAYTEIYSA